jgi:dienelactone hydrolase
MGVAVDDHAFSLPQPLRVVTRVCDFPAAMAEEILSGGLQGTLLTPAERTGLGVIVLHGSSGQADVARARLFSERGAVALALRWFGGEGQIPGICEVPLELFAMAVDRLAAMGCERIALVGTSKGAEAALLVAVHDPRITAVVATSPSSVVWGNSGPGSDGVEWPQRSSWTLAGRPLPYVAYDPYWRREMRDGLVTYRSLFEQSLRRFAAEALEAAIPVERAKADIILVAGGDDALWPSELFARDLADRCTAAGKPVCLVVHPDAGHRVLLPGETKPRSTLHAHGGGDQADAALGRSAWTEIVARLNLAH